MNLEDKLKNTKFWRRYFLTIGAAFGGFTGNELTQLVVNYMNTYQVNSNLAISAVCDAMIFGLLGKRYMKYYSEEQDLKEQIRNLKK